jgi:Uncharacterized protein conserved in bacteria (DUF2314)
VAAIEQKHQPRLSPHIHAGCHVIIEGSVSRALSDQGTGGMGKYQKGDHVKIEVSDEQFGASEWMWMLVADSDDEQQLVFGELDNEPVVNTDLRLGQQLAVSYNKIREHRRFNLTH